MHIIIVSKEFAPYIETSERSHEIATLAKWIKKQDHQVSCVIPLDPQLDIKAFSLARRLMPIKVKVNEHDISFVRYDGRTPEGVDVLLLEKQDTTPKADVQETDSRFKGNEDLFLNAVGVLLTSFASKPDALLLFGGNGSPLKNEGIPIVVTPDIENENLDTLINMSRSANRLVLTDSQTMSDFVTALPQIKNAQEESGKVVAISYPPATIPQHLDKPSAKVAAQIQLDLPVRHDVPLTLFGQADKDVVLDFVARDVQAIAVEPSGGSLDETKDAYKDRLALIPSEKIDHFLAAADACVVDDNIHLLKKALASGVLPIVSSRIAQNIVDIEPSLETGSGIVMAGESNRESTNQALGRLVGAFDNQSAFAQLLSRLPNYISTWEEVASHYVNVIEETTREQKDHEQK